MTTPPAPVRISDIEMIKTMGYLGINLEQKIIYNPERNYSEVKNYFKRSFDWSNEYFEGRTKKFDIFRPKIDEIFKSVYK